MKKPKYAILKKCDKCGKPQQPYKIVKDSAFPLHFKTEEKCECGGEFNYKQVPYAEYESFITSLLS